MSGLKPICPSIFTSDQIDTAKRLSKKQAAPFAVVQLAKLMLMLAQRLTERILAFQEYYLQNATPFNRRYTCEDLKRQYQRLQFAT